MNKVNCYRVALTGDKFCTMMTAKGIDEAEKEARTKFHNQFIAIGYYEWDERVK